MIILTILNCLSGFQTVGISLIRSDVRSAGYVLGEIINLKSGTTPEDISTAYMAAGNQ